MDVRHLDPHTFDWATGAGGAAEVRRIADAAAAYDGRDPLNEAARLTLRHHGLDTGTVLLATGVDARPLGFAYVHGLSGESRPEVELVVSPDSRGRGVGRALAAVVLEEVTDIPVTAWSHGNHPAAAAIARRFEFRAVRELWLMRRSAGALPVADVPPGFTVRAFRPGEDEAGFLAVNAVAFADHPEQGTLDRAGLSARMGEPWFDPAGFLVATDPSGTVCGFHWTKVHDPAPPHGEVYVIGVAPSAQGTGLGRALLRAGLAHLESRGLAETVLYVEGENTGAIRLYESFGFTHAARDTDVMYARTPVRPRR